MTEPGDQPAPIDLARLADLMGEEDRAELFETLDFFVEEFPAEMASLETAISAQNRQAVRDAAHALKSAAASAAATPLFKLFAKMEAEAATADWNVIGDMAAAARGEFLRIVKFVQDHC